MSRSRSRIAAARTQLVVAELAPARPASAARSARGAPRSAHPSALGQRDQDDAPVALASARGARVRRDQCRRASRWPSPGRGPRRTPARLRTARGARAGRTGGRTARRSARRAGGSGGRAAAARPPVAPLNERPELRRRHRAPAGAAAGIRCRSRSRRDRLMATALGSAGVPSGDLAPERRGARSARTRMTHGMIASAVSPADHQNAVP